jgi:hypothetical protein
MNPKCLLSPNTPDKPKPKLIFLSGKPQPLTADDFVEIVVAKELSLKQREQYRAYEESIQSIFLESYETSR